ncbi:hypothetical protein DPMN_031537 [Dreissena polymorpha]|uniref:Uncharacterized protein n=1 Tax=Dreissena polymorpha TaxID=45954 RepID=A0A9D4M4T6_DREPO|nr:hypothetical protein DPMN_031537 [Dreissena polymorpha]
MPLIRSSNTIPPSEQQQQQQQQQKQPVSRPDTLLQSRQQTLSKETTNEAAPKTNQKIIPFTDSHSTESGTRQNTRNNNCSHMAHTNMVANFDKPHTRTVLHTSGNTKNS